MDWIARTKAWQSALRLRLLPCLVVVLMGPSLEAQPPRAGSATPVELRIEGSEVATLQDELEQNLHAADDDGWQTEVLSSAAGAVLKRLVGGLEDLDSLTRAEVEAFLGYGFSTDELRPSNLHQAFSDGELTVRRWNGVPSAKLRGGAGLMAALAGLVDGLGLRDGEPSALQSGPLQKQIKPIQVELGASGLDNREFGATFLYEVSVQRSGGSIQQNAVWTTRWAYPDAEGSQPRLLGIKLDQYEEAEWRSVGRAESSTLFVDATASAMATVEAYDAQVLPGLDHWFPRVSRLAGMSFLGHHGLAVGDVNGDGLEDLYVTDAGGLPNRLYLQQDDGTLRDASSESGTDWLDPSVSALLVDLDGDADEDLVVVTAARLLLHENDGSGHFSVRESLFEVVTAPTSLSAADYDEDGDLDLFLCGYSGDRDSRSIPGPVPYHDAQNGGRNALLKNLGSFRFEDVTESVGLGQNNNSFSFAAAWDDYDDDGDVDLYVANDFGRNNLYENTGGNFRDVAEQAGVQDVASGMSAAWGDYDRDGRRDMYVSNMFSSAGNRVAYQRRFVDAGSGKTVPDQTLADIQRMARGNTLFRNAGDGSFDDVTIDAGVHMGLWAWASRFADLNNDGWLDLVVSNGYVTNRESNDL